MTIMTSIMVPALPIDNVDKTDMRGMSTRVLDYRDDCDCSTEYIATSLLFSLACAGG